MYFHQALHQDDSVLLVNYEKLVKDPRSHLARVFNHIELEFRPHYYRKVNTKSVGKDSPPEIDGEIQTLCSELLDRLNEHYGRVAPDY